jgi:probable F420-dependent oxidoreductase
VPVNLGRIGVWRRRNDGPGPLAQIEALGYGALWIGGSPSVEDARPYLQQTSTLTIATGILNVWQHEPAAVAAQRAQLARDYPDRFLLGIGIGHPEATAEYTTPLARMRAYFDGLDQAPEPVPRDQRAAAALGPKMLDLVAERSLGAHTYFVTAEHTRFARERLGPEALIAPELAVVLETDAETARATARSYAKLYLGLRNYTSNLKRFGFSEADIADGGSDRLIDAVVPHGSPAAIAEAVRAHLDAGADHVALQPLRPGGASLGDYEALAGALL